MLITYYPNGQPYIVEDRVNGIRKGEVRIYNVSGQLINTITYDNLQVYSISYYQNDTRHNEHGPASIIWYANLQVYSISYYQNDKRHNLHGPDHIRWYAVGQIYWISWCQNGKCHNLHGPTFICWAGGRIYIDYRHFGKLIKEISY